MEWDREGGGRGWGEEGGGGGRGGRRGQYEESLFEGLLCWMEDVDYVEDFTVNLRGANSFAPRHPPIC